MTANRSIWLLVGLAALVPASVVYPHANVQSPTVPLPLITEALVDVETAALTINGYDFPTSVPQVTLGMTELAVVSATESALLAGLPDLLPGTYLLAATWPEGVGAVFFLTLGAAGPAGPPGPQGPQGNSGVFLSTAPESSYSMATSGERAAADEDGSYTPQDHSGSTTNTHLGARALAAVTEGRGNTAVGSDTLRSLTTGEQNAGFGWQTLRSLTSGRSNLAIGTASMVRVTDGSFNTAIGSDTLKATNSGEDNVAIGTGALLFSLGNQNVGIGRSALRRNEDGSGNIAIGYGAGRNNLTGSNNVYIGNVGARDDEGVIRIGTEGVHNRIHIAGEVVGGAIAPVYQP
ncbi:MAG: hypothetical protein OXF27_06910 [Acidobacteria bacterium]|nr:hypothetical protein [Acidobacteriota bacterium]